MPNLLVLPFKKTYTIDVKDVARKYLQEHTYAHPDAFKWDVSQWQNLRKDGIGGVVHIDRIDALLSYHAQLVSILTKLPTNIGLEIPYAPVFSPSGLPITLKNLAFERAAVLFNLASLYSQLASTEDRSSEVGIRRATLYYQNAAGTLSYLISSALPQLVFSPDDEDIPLDLSVSFVKSLEWLMLAQAQECGWQKAKMDNLKNGLIARVATRAASLYRSAVTAIRESSYSLERSFPSDWIPHIETKQHHFEAVAQYRKSVDDLEANRYGHELARLGRAQIEAKTAYDIARRGKVAPAVLQDVKSLLENVQKNLARAERDNDLIYHQDIPAHSALPQIMEAELAKLILPSGLINPNSVIGEDGVIFGELLGWGAQEAINIYNDRKQNLVVEKITNVAQELKAHAAEYLRNLNLPSALEALERPVGLPPSLLKKAEEVRLENGPAKIEASIQDVQRLALQDTNILNEAMDILDKEASEDEAARRDKPLSQLPSHQANQELVEKERRYRTILEQAAASDEIVREKWDEWERNITELTWDEADLEASVPSSSVSTIGGPVPRSSQTTQTLVQARALRVLLESLDNLQETRERLIQRARIVAEADDIHPRILRAASGFERLVDVQPAMFEDILDEELAKYDKFLREMTVNEQKQTDLLTDIKACNEAFLQTRRDDPLIKEREHKLQSLDLAYHKYREITQNLDEGFKFYNDLAGIFMQFRDSCKIWSRRRTQGIHSLAQSLQSTSLDGDTPKKTSHPPRSAPTTTPHKLPKSTLGLPSITSSEWDFQDIPLPPGPANKKQKPA